MKIRMRMLMCCLGLFLTTIPARADRKGFFLSIGGGAGKELKALKKMGGLGVGRIGAGVSDNFTLYYTAPTFITTQTVANVKTTYLIGGNQVGASLFFSKGSSFYLTAGGGLGVYYQSPVIGSSYKLGWSATAGAGIEFQVGKTFAFGIEADYMIVSANHRKFHIPFGILNLAWYF